MNRSLYVVNEDGEVVDKIDSSDKYVKLSQGDRVIRNKSIKYLSETVDMRYKFVKINPLVYDDIANKYPIINTLLRYLGYMDGILSYKNGQPLKLKDIAKICNVSESTAKRKIKGLMEEDVIHKLRDKKLRQTYLIMNPYVAVVGKKVSLSLYEEFKLSAFRNRCEE